MVVRCGCKSPLLVFCLAKSPFSSSFDFPFKIRVPKRKGKRSFLAYLKIRLNVYVQGNKEEFIRHAQTEVSRLSNAGERSVAISFILLCIVAFLLLSFLLEELQTC